MHIHAGVWKRRCVHACVKRVGLHTVWWNIQLSIRCVVTVCRWKRLSGGIKRAYPVTQWMWMRHPWLWCRVCGGDQVTWMEGIKGLLIFTRQMGLIIVWGGGEAVQTWSHLHVCDRGRAGVICCLSMFVLTAMFVQPLIREPHLQKHHSCCSIVNIPPSSVQRRRLLLLRFHVRGDVSASWHVIGSASRRLQGGGAHSLCRHLLLGNCNSPSKEWIWGHQEITYESHHVTVRRLFWA